MTDYYVSPTGNNNNSGRSPNEPWRSIQKGLDALSAGDTLHIMEGTYSPGDEGIDSWRVSRKRGDAKAKIMIKNYNAALVRLSGEEDGAAKGFPQTGLKVFTGSKGSYTYNGVTYQTTYAALFDIEQSSYITVEGIHVVDSLGEAFNINDSDHITLNGIRAFNIRSRAMTFRNSKHLELTNSELDFCNWGKMSGSGGPNAHNCEDVYVDNNLLTQLDGEGMVFDAGCRNIYVRNNTCFDISRVAIYITGSDNVIVTGNFIFPTEEDLAAGPGANQGSGGFNPGGGGKAISINSQECDFTTLQKGSKYVLVAHNIIHNMSLGVLVKTEPGTQSNCIPDYVRQPMEYIYVVNNTVLNASDYSFRFNSDTFNNCVFKNNISVNTDPLGHVNSGDGNVSGVDSDNNFYSSTVSIPSNFTGPNDITNRDPRLEGPGERHKPKPVKQEDANGWYVSTGPISKETLDARGFRLRSNSLCIDAAQTIKAPSGWSEMNDYLVSSFDFDRSGTPPKRTGAWDIGPHEYRASEAITADFAARPTSGTSPLAVSFKDTSESSSPITSRFWDFGDGVISTEKDPTHEYAQGQFTVSLRVTSSAGTDIVTKSNLITVTAPAEPLPERVTRGLSVLYRFNEGSGDTIYDVSGVGTPLDLRISDPSTINWLGQGIGLAKKTVIVSNGPATKINEAIRQTNELTLEAWIHPNLMYQDGPARILTISKNMHSRNVTLGHGLWGTQPSDLYDVRLRTTERSANGMPSFSTPSGTTEQRKTHVVYLRQSNGLARYIVDGTVVAETTIPGDFSTWNPRFPLLLGNETTGDYPWLGKIYLVAIYHRALTVNEVKQNFAAGTEAAPLMMTHQPVLATSFRRFVLVKNGVEGAVAGDVSRALAYGVEYPDKRCVLCASGNTSSMAIYADANSILRAYGKQGLKISWLD